MNMGGPPDRASGPARTDGKVLPFQALPQNDQQRGPRLFAISFNPPCNGADERCFRSASSRVPAFHFIGDVDLKSRRISETKKGALERSLERPFDRNTGLNHGPTRFSRQTG
jgi:hypothetical protein